MHDEPDEPDRVDKRQIAEIQLHRAVMLLDSIDKDYDPVSALTLAGAAEEILGKMVAKEGMVNAFDEAALAAKELWKEAISLDSANAANIQLPSDEELRVGLNRVRNELKHNNLGTNSKVEAYFWYEAEEMVKRALNNYKKLYNELPPQKEIREWWG